MLSGPRQKFCEGIVRGLSAAEAYREAYPEADPHQAAKNTTRLTKNDEVKAEIARLRKKAEERAGSAVLTLAEKRTFIARLVRADLKGEVDGDLLQSVEHLDGGTKYRLGDKLAAIKLDNDLAGEGSEAKANDAIADSVGALLERIRA